MKRLSILFMLVCLLVPAAMVNAQDTLEVGTPLAGEITNSSFEVEYGFSGTAGSIVIISMPTVDEDGWANDLDGQIILLDSENNVVSDTFDNYCYGCAVLVTELPADDDYIVLATREDGRSGDTEGTYEIELITPDVLGMGDSATGQVSSEGGAAYFTINSEEDFVMIYSKTAGDYNPEILVSTISDNNSDLEGYTAASGQLDGVAMGNMEAGIYIVKVDEDSQFYFYSSDELTADFEIAVVSAE
jgi:hypothetical protein